MTGAVKINLQFIKWELIIAAFLFLAAVFIARRKGIKRAVFFMIIMLAVLMLAFFTKYTVYLALDDAADAMRFGIVWGPTVEFTYILFVYTVFGVWRGFRKSALFMLHAVCAAAVCVGLFFFFTRSAAFDRWLLKVINKIMGSGGLQARLNVSEECATLREVFAEWIPSRMNYGTEVTIILRENGAYLQTLADMAMRIVFAYVCYLLYLLLVFILYIVYHVAYSERKYKRRKEIAVRENRTDSQYRKHALAGGVLGFVRGLAAGVISMSLLGSVFFMVADVGKNKMSDLSFDNENLDFAFSAYQAFEDYGSHGIFRLLNGLSGPDNSPYYLFAADLIFSGHLTDENLGIDTNVKFRKEIAAYTRFARETVELMLRYGDDEVRAVLEGKSTGSKKDALLSVMQNEQFQREFENLIDEFEAQTYIINFALSAVNSLLVNIDDTRFASLMSENTREMMKVLFKQGYLSAAIPDERALLESGKKQGAQPYIHVAQVFTKEDAKILFRMVTSFLTADSEEDTDDTLQLVRTLLPQMQQLSVVSAERADGLNGVYGRLYCYLANTYLSDEESEGVYYRDVANARVSWVEEINALITVAEDGFVLYDAVRENEGSSMDKLLDLFDEQADDYDRKMEAYDRVAQTASSCKLIGQVMRTSYMYGKLTDVFASVSENMYIPTSVVYENTAEGYGEIHNLMYGLKLLGKKENRELLATVTDSEEDAALADIFELLGGVATHADAFGRTLSDYMTESLYLRSLISTVMIEDGGESLYVPESVWERDVLNNPIPMIEKATLAQLFEAFKDGEVRSAILEFVEEDDSDTEQSRSVAISKLIKNDAVARVLDLGNGIIEGTVSMQLVLDLQENSKVVVPPALRMGEDDVLPAAWLTRGSVSGELRRMIAALRLADNETIDAILDNGTITKDHLKAVLHEDENAVDILLASEVIYHTVSRSVLEGNVSLSKTTVVVPVSVVEKLPDGSALIAKSELTAFMTLIDSFDITADMTTKKMLAELTNHKEDMGNSVILCASVANYILTDDDVRHKIYVPQSYDKPSGYATHKDWLEQSRDGAPLWRREIVTLASAVHILFDLDSEDDELHIYSSRLRQADSAGELDTVLASGVLCGTMSDNILKNVSLVVPHTVLAAKDMLTADELRALLRAFVAYTEFMGEDGDIENWEPNWIVPDEQTANVIVHSAVIRATVTDEIRAVNEKQANAQRVHLQAANAVTATWVRMVGEENAEYAFKELGSITVIEEEQILAMMAALRTVASSSEQGTTFVIPVIDADTVRELMEERNNLAVYAECDALRYRIDAVVQNMLKAIERIAPEHPALQQAKDCLHSEEWTVLSDILEQTFRTEILAADRMNDCLDALQELQKDFDLGSLQ